MKNLPKNKVVLIGGNHHNGLNLARIFGEYGIRPYGIIIKDRQKCYTAKSRYWEKTWVVENEDAALKVLLAEFPDEACKTVVIPWSDGAAAKIDQNLDLLKQRYVTQSIAGKTGAICKLMNKMEQVDFANKNELPVAKTWIYDFEQQLLPDDLCFPCILKPVTSFEGDKKDIRKCDDIDSINECIKMLREKGYKSILIQEFLRIDYEFLIFGCCGFDEAYIIRKNLRIWEGTASYGQIINIPQINRMGLRILQILEQIGYNGLFDIEMFMVKNKIYLNEINWRNSGADFMCLGTGVLYPVIWYLSAVGWDSSSIPHFSSDENQYQMDEATDLRHVFFGELTFKQWNKERKKTQSFSLSRKGDNRPKRIRYRKLIIEMIKRIVKKNTH